jgi:kinesin family member 11
MLFVRRPLSDKEIVERTPQVITCNEVQREVTLFSSSGGKTASRTFRFDKVRAENWICMADELGDGVNVSGQRREELAVHRQVFGPDASQEKLFKQAITPIVDEVMEGFNCTIFAYGQVRCAYGQV